MDSNLTQEGPAIVRPSHMFQGNHELSYLDDHPVRTHTHPIMSQPSSLLYILRLIFGQRTTQRTANRQRLTLTHGRSSWKKGGNMTKSNARRGRMRSTRCCYL